MLTVRERTEYKMAKFRVWAECITDCYLDVEAKSEEEALNIAAETDGGEFITDDSYGSGDWRVTHAYPLEEEDK